MGMKLGNTNDVRDAVWIINIYWEGAKLSENKAFIKETKWFVWKEEYAYAY